MQTKLLPLTGFRAIAVYFVFLHHWYRTIGIPASFLPYVFECHIGVTLFFVLSGYLMALRYAEFEKNLEIKKILHFYWARATRILPVFWLLTLAHFLFVYLTLRQWDRTSFFLNLLVVKGWSQSYFLSGIPQAWSMTVELTFYLLAPFLIAAVARGLGFWVWLLITSLGIFHALILWVPVPLPGEMSSFYFTALYTFLGRCFEFLFGIGIALFYRGKNFQSGNKKLAWWSYGSFIFILASPFILSLFKESSNSLGSSLGFYTIRGAAFNNLILPEVRRAFHT
jgi:peptidoglycan/LPS O-acetylase OafA/YrhL